MKSMVVYSSRTGNTKAVAEAIQAAMPEGCELYAVEEAPSSEAYELVAVGFWVDRGTADANAQKYLGGIKNKTVILFGTLGAFPDSDHARDSMARAAMLLPQGNALLGTFICQGRVDPKIVKRFKDLPAGHPHAPTPESIARQQAASCHPDEADFARAKKVIEKIVAGIGKHY
jgi:flavodoxin